MVFRAMHVREHEPLLAVFLVALSGLLTGCGSQDPNTVLVPASDSAFRFVGRFDEFKFDYSGCEIQFRIEGATEVAVLISQQLGVESASITDFLVYIDGQALTVPIAGSQCTYCTFDTSGIVEEAVEEYVFATRLTPDPHEIRIMRTTEAAYGANQAVGERWVTFHGLRLDRGSVLPPSMPRRPRRIEFLGDSITAGYCNLCEGPGPWSEQPPSSRTYSDAHSGEESGASSRRLREAFDQSFALSWPTIICERLGAECHTAAWSGLGLIRNCCGVDFLMPEVWTRTLASGPTGGLNTWDFSKWVPDALVINLGTNDGGEAGDSPAFVDRYIQLVQEAHGFYGPNLHFFLACGPMRDYYCDSVLATLANITSAGIRAHFLDQRAFLNGTFGPGCCNHPGAEIDFNMGVAGSDFIADVMGWDTTEIASADYIV